MGNKADRNLEITVNVELKENNKVIIANFKIFKTDELIDYASLDYSGIDMVSKRIHEFIKYNLKIEEF